MIVEVFSPVRVTEEDVVLPARTQRAEHAGYVEVTTRSGMVLRISLDYHDRVRVEATDIVGRLVVRPMSTREIAIEETSRD